MAISRNDLLHAIEPALMALLGNEPPTSKEQAKREGKNFYYDDRLCRNGHVALKRLNGHCTRCISKKKEKNT